MRTRLALAALAVAFGVVPTAFAQPALQLGGVDTSTYPTVRLSVVTPAPSQRPPALRENGRPVVGLTAENLGRAKSIVLALDRSQSMRGEPMLDAANAARAFVGAKPADDRIAIVSVGSQAVPLTNFGSSTIDADAALGAMEVDSTYGTALWDSVVLSSRLLDSESLPARVLILLTDGQETTSKGTLEGAIASARQAGVSVYVIGIESEKFQPEPLQQLAAATGGGYFAAANSDSLQAVYGTIAEELRRTWRLAYLTAAQGGETVKLEARLGGATVTKSVRIQGDSSGVIVTPSPSPLLPGFLYERNLGTMVLALFSGACAILAVGLLFATPGSERLRRRIEPHAEIARKRVDTEGPKERFAVASGILLATEKSLSKLRFWRAMHRLIDRADLPLRTVEFFYICAGAGLLLGLLAAVAAAPSPAILFLMLLGGAAPVGWVWFKAKRRMAAIDDQLPDLLMTIAASLKAGHSFRQGIQAVVDEGQPPTSDEFKRVLTETSLGRPMDDALDEMAERIGSKNLTFVITAVTIQRQVGGSLAGIFDMVADAVRDRQQFERKIRSLTAMGRMSAGVLIGLPFFIAGALTVLNREYMAPLFETSTGHLLIGMTLVMMAIGSVLLQKIVSMKG